MSKLILRVGASGLPLAWMSWREAVLLYSAGKVLWTAGGDALRFYGGVNSDSGERSYLDVHPVVAIKGRAHAHAYRRVPPLTNRELFSRDGHICMYCLHEYRDAELTRDHVIPVSKGGLDIWSNVVTACRACNQRKADRTPRQANMKLHAVPYAPSYAEWLILRNRRILADQMAFLRAVCGGNKINEN